MQYHLRVELAHPQPHCHGFLPEMSMCVLWIWWLWELAMP